MKAKRNGFVVFTWILFFCMSLLCFGTKTVRAKSMQKVTITLHYERKDANYQDWSSWVWVAGQDGKQYDFDTVGRYGAEAKIVLKNISLSDHIGFLIKYKEWEKKDVDGDRFFDLSKLKNGKLDVYLQSGENTVEYDKARLEKESHFLYARWEDVDRIAFRAYLCKKDDGRQRQLTVTDENGAVCNGKITQWKKMGSYVTGVYQLEEEMKLYHAYFCKADRMVSFAVSWGKVFDSKRFAKMADYTGDDLGIRIAGDKVSFCVWAPTAQNVNLLIYADGEATEPEEKVAMTAGTKGEWKCRKDQSVIGKYYTYEVTVQNQTNEAVDPYARSTGVNGKKGMILDTAKAIPTGFSRDVSPQVKNKKDAIIYELSVRDFTSSDSSGVKNKGKYLGLTEKHTVNEQGDSTGLDYLKQLGVTYVQIMPVQDFYGIDEETGEGYNWGYNPQNYNVPEGSYATDAHHGEVRVEEYKKMIQALHQAGICVIMDVVYNHSYESDDSNFNKIVPGYYYRYDVNGTLSNGSGCGNEIASERDMVRKMIVDSVCYWNKEYHVDGFRFDLMGLLDETTMREVSYKLKAQDANILIYGEGWNAGTSSYKAKTAVSTNGKELPDIGFFNNCYRTAIQQFICGQDGEHRQNVYGVQFGTVGAVNYSSLKKKMGSWTKYAKQSLQYASCHDGYTLYDTIKNSTGTEADAEHEKRNKISAALIMTGAGIPFFQSGEEFLRTKTNASGQANGNSYNAGDAMNAIDWNLRSEHKNMVSFYRNMIQLRKKQDEFAVNNMVSCNKDIQFEQDLPSGMLGYEFSKTHFGVYVTSVKVICNTKNKEQTYTVNGKKQKMEPLQVSVSLGRSFTTAGIVYITGAVFLLIALLFLLLYIMRKKRRANS